MSPKGNLAFVLSFSKPLTPLEINGKLGIQNAQASFEISDLFLSNSVQERRKELKAKLFSEVHSNFQAKKEHVMDISYMKVQNKEAFLIDVKPQ